MTNISAISQKELGLRRQRLRRQRRQKLSQILWQSITVFSVTYGVLWAIAQPIWKLEKPEQIKVEGNQLLSPPTIRLMLSLSYPQSLWGIEPNSLAKKLESSGPIAKANVTRHLFPPGLTIQVKEKRPVAIALETTPMPPGSSMSSTNNQSVQKTGWLDINGNWMPLESYQRIETTSTKTNDFLSSSGKTMTLPTLKVIGRIQQYGTYWPKFYQTLSSSRVKILEVDWQDPGNIILKTDLGLVHLGPYTPQLPEQLQVLDQMRELPKQLDFSKISYLDLKNPATPVIQMATPKQP
ncbi:MAG: cell division protein FtsQ/DivIB [Microcoleaceae cyanobacterium]|jgi:cell division protein FtsQ